MILYTLEVKLYVARLLATLWFPISTTLPHPIPSNPKTLSRRERRLEEKRG